jgi:hypothetical protein
MTPQLARENARMMLGESWRKSVPNHLRRWKPPRG